MMKQTADMVIKAQAGDSGACEELYMQTKNKAYFLALQLLKNPQDAEDALQDAYIIAFSKINDAIPDKFQGWLDTIVINRAKDVLKKKKPMVFSELQTSDGKEYVPEDEEERIEFLPEENMDYQETKRLVQEIIDELPEEQRIAIMLYYYKEMSVVEIAEYFECATGTVKSRLNYARKAIKSKVEVIEKKGTKLYCVPILPFLYWMLHTEAAETVCTSTNILQGLQESSASDMITRETIKSSTDSIVRASAGNGIKGFAAKLGELSIGMKVGLIAVATTIGIAGGIAAYQALSSPTEIVGSTISDQSDDEENRLVSQGKEDENISNPDVIEKAAINEENDELLINNESKEDNSETDEKSIEETNAEAQNEPTVSVNNTSAPIESTDDNLEVVTTNSGDASTEPEVTLEGISENESNAEITEIDATYKRLKGYGYKGNLWISNISNIKGEGEYYVLTADVYAPETISEEDYDRISNGLLTSWNIAGTVFNIEPVTEADDSWDYGEYKFVSGDSVYYIDNTDEQADGDIEDYYDIAFGASFIRPEGSYYIKDIENQHLLYKLLETKIDLKVNNDIDIELLEDGDYSSYTIGECISSNVTGQNGQNFEESTGQIVFDDSGRVSIFYEDFYK